MNDYTEKQVQLLSMKIFRVIDEHMNAGQVRGGEREKLAVSMSALVKVLSAMAAAVGMPPEAVTEVIKAEMDEVFAAIVDNNETKH
jgi:hypothetical protein